MNLRAHTAAAATCLLAATLTVPVAADGPQYTLTLIAPLSQHQFADATADCINDLGQVGGGSSDEFNEMRPTLWLPSPAFGMLSGPNDLGDLGYGGGRIYGMNDVGQCVGFVAPPPEDGGWARAFRWDPDGSMVDLGLLGGNYSIAHGVNDAGFVVGDSSSDDPAIFRAAFLHDGETMIDLGSFGGIETRAYAINSLGQITGYSTYDDEDPWNSRIRVFLWLPEPAYGLPAGLHDIDDQSTALQQTSQGRAINEKGQIAGWAAWINENGQSVTQLGLWLPEPAYGLPAGFNDLRGFGGDRRKTAFAHDINDRGEIVIRADLEPDNPFGGWAAVLWRQGEWFNLHECIPAADQPSWYFGSATGINDSGQITGWGIYEGEYWSYLLTPVLDAAPCAANTNGDDVVDVDDLINVILDWGQTTSDADVNADGIVDVDDLVAVILAWGPCPAGVSGACCFALTGDCQTLNESDCDFMGGVWSPGVTCDTLTCPMPPSGACCFSPSGQCTEQTEMNCGLGGGTWQGDDSSCEQTQCPVPATGDRFEDPFSIDAMPFSTAGSTVGFEDDYDLLCPYGGSTAPDVVYAFVPQEDMNLTVSLCGNTDYDSKVYIFENTQAFTVGCNDDACTSPSYPDPYVSRIDLAQLTAGNTYYLVVDGYGPESGNYTLEIDFAIAGACCLPDGFCGEATEEGCVSFGGTWQGADTECISTSCPPPAVGACCLGGGGCVNTNEYACGFVYGGQWMGPETTCGTTECP